MRSLVRVTICLFFIAILTACSTSPTARGAQKGALIGAGAGAVIGAITSAKIAATTVGGAAVGGLIGAANSIRGHNALLLEQQGIHVIRLGDGVKLVLPSDRLFDINSARLNSNSESLLRNSIRFIQSYGDVPLVIAGFTDNVAVEEGAQQLTEFQAQRVAAYLWSHGGIDWQRMQVVGYGQAGAISTNRNAIGSAQNRRIEISFRQQQKV